MMVLHVNFIEALWVTVNGATAVVTWFAFLDARRDRSAVKALNGGALRTRIANGSVRREQLRLVVQLLLLSIAVPGLFVDNATPLTPPVAALIAVPVVLLIASLHDTNERHAVTALTLAHVVAERDQQMTELGDKIDASAAASRSAEAASNNTNEKIADLNERLVEQGDRAEAEIARTDEHQEVQDGRLDAQEGSA